MTWEEFLDTPVDTYFTGQTQTDIECPECGRKVYFDSTITLTSYPAKYKYWCACGWSDCSPSRWVKGYERKE